MHDHALRGLWGALFLGLALNSCGSTRDLVHGPPLTASSRQPDSGPNLEGWDRLSNTQFEALALGTLPAGEVIALDEFLLAELEGALQDPGQRAVRAAVLLGRSGTRAAGEALLGRLERRVLNRGRNQDAADVVAAGALERMPSGAWAAGRLAVLGAGPKPHPDLEVRVGCAAAALLFGRDEVIPFLLQVLRIGTSAGRTEALDFTVSDTTTWARSEAAIALARRAGIPNRYAADGPLEMRAKVARELASLLLR